MPLPRDPNKCRLTDLTFGYFMMEILADIWDDVCCDEFPRNACADTCAAIFDLVSERFDGEFTTIDGEFKGSPHTWILETNSGKIVDPTIGQFVAGPAWRVFTPGHYQYKYYTPWENEDA